MNGYDRAEFERVKGQAKLYGEDSLNSLDKWRLRRSRDEDERDGERARARQAEPSEVERLRAEMQQEIAAVRAEMVERHEAALEAAGAVIGEYSDKTFDLAERTIKEVRDLLTVTMKIDPLDTLLREDPPRWPVVQFPQIQAYRPLVHGDKPAVAA